jgi:ABC-type nickel/cobalt efflux system permease component RcnA
MKRIVTLVLAALAAAFTLPVGSAAAHPLGNFTVNQHTRIEVASDAIYVRYIVDMAEIPAFSERQLIDADSNGEVSAAEQEAYLDRIAPALAEGLLLTIAENQAPLRITQRELSFPPGEGGLATLRLALDLVAMRSSAGAPLLIQFSNTNYTERIGWREIIATDGEGVTIAQSSVPAIDRSDELRAYPDDLTANPPDIRSATLTAIPAPGGGAPRAIGTQPVAATRGADLAALTGDGALTPITALGALLLAFLLGAGHALTPGHGKTVAAAYLVGTRGTFRHAIALGVVTTITHTAGVFVLGIVTLTLSRYVLPEQVYPWIELISGVLVVAIGAGLLRARLRHLLRPTQQQAEHIHHHHHGDQHDHDHAHDHDHTHDHHHHHGPGGHTHEEEHRLADWVAGAAGAEAKTGAPPFGWRGLIALGVSGGLLPCPSALVVLLGAIAVGRVGFGMLLIVAFSAGLAAVLTAIGMLLAAARDLFQRMPAGGRLLRVMPVVSALIVTGVGIAISAAAVLQVSA